MRFDPVNASELAEGRDHFLDRVIAVCLGDPLALFEEVKPGLQNLIFGDLDRESVRLLRLPSSHHANTISQEAATRIAK